MLLLLGLFKKSLLIKSYFLIKTYRAQYLKYSREHIREHNNYFSVVIRLKNILLAKKLYNKNNIKLYFIYFNKNIILRGIIISANIQYPRARLKNSTERDRDGVPIKCEGPRNFQRPECFLSEQYAEAAGVEKGKGRSKSYGEARTSSSIRANGATHGKGLWSLHTR